MMISENENKAIVAIADALPAVERMQLLEDLALARVLHINPDRSIIEFEISGYIRPPGHGQKPFEREGTLLDEDGEVL